MDRLLSGDVGYGKTEVAVRAAFKAVQDGKQVAMIVPTTLLVRQHMETFAERFAGFPVHLRALSRFQTDKEAKETIAGMADGTVDVVIGTHRLLSKNIVFKDLGLVIIDEEQRFGVEHKDALKKLKTNVDILAMTATPIPRTLEMAVTGIREMSTLATPPEDRHPILSFVGPYSDRQVAAAIRRELLREGQIFYVHNRVSSISRVAAQLAELVPEARIAVAHGQMAEHVLEQVMVDFWERKFDVLVSTTIIETGLDIANANTIIIDRADKYGLSQLHQLRGRVGRGRERAYAYFLYDEIKPLTETAPRSARRRSRRTTSSARGMQIALKDLEIRGAGNLLGGEQSGHIAGVGFDLYLRMIGEAVSTFRGDVAEGQTELRLELPVDAHIPEDYVESERLRLEAYQKLSTASAPTRHGRQHRPGARGAHRPLRRTARAGAATSSPCRDCAAWRRRPGSARSSSMGDKLRRRAGRPRRLDPGAAAAHVPGRAVPRGRGGRARAAADGSDGCPAHRVDHRPAGGDLRSRNCGGSRRNGVELAHGLLGCGVRRFGARSVTSSSRSRCCLLHSRPTSRTA